MTTKKAPRIIKTTSNLKLRLVQIDGQEWYYMDDLKHFLSKPNYQRLQLFGIDVNYGVHDGKIIISTHDLRRFLKTVLNE